MMLNGHIVLLDVSKYGLTGRQAESALLDAGVVTNRNSVPNDPNGAWYTSGVRIGTPALTSRGFGADAYGYAAEDVNGRYSIKTTIREQFAKIGEVFDVVIRRKPKFLGPKETLPDV